MAYQAKCLQSGLKITLTPASRYQIYSKTEISSQGYFQPKVGRKIRIFMCSWNIQPRLEKIPIKESVWHDSKWLDICQVAYLGVYGPRQAINTRKQNEASISHSDHREPTQAASLVVCSKCKEMYGRILKSLNIVNLYRGMSKLKLKINVAFLSCCVYFVARHNG